ncbi:MAG: hypothetical protein BVN33_02850 [Proteobacteria bacterium ST_bin13]|nr:MAG: hypothetical protein BVN33_02850 [Proteobacteria bacterium ST_bin13]
MYAERNDRPGAIKPGSLAMAMAINAGVLSAVLLAAPEIIKIKPPVPIEIINIPIEPPPPPEPVQPRAKTDPAPQQKPILADPIIKIDRPVDVTFPGTTIIPTGPAGTSEGTGVIIDPPAPPPVLIEPSIDDRYRSSFQPAYPPAEQRAERSGFVVVRVLIGIDGRVSAVERVSATSDDFFETTRRTALSKWRFNPATRGGAPVERWRVMRVTFQIEEA